ncbi:MAG: ATP-binding protein, partial [Pseudomonadota bacterium]
MSRQFSLEGKLALITTILVCVGVFLTFALFSVINLPWLVLLLTLALMVPLSIYVVERFMTPINRVLQALTDGVASFRDSDFSISITQNRNDELGDLVGLYNTVGEVLRDERQDLFQRELLLDTIIQATPIALILCNNRSQIVYSNASARRLLHAGRKMEGNDLDAILENSPPGLSRAISEKNDGLFSIDVEAKPSAIAVFPTPGSPI